MCKYRYNYKYKYRTEGAWKKNCAQNSQIQFIDTNTIRNTNTEQRAPGKNVYTEGPGKNCV